MLDFRNYIRNWDRVFGRLQFEIHKYTKNLKRNTIIYALTVIGVTFFLLVFKTCNWSKPSHKKTDKYEAIKMHVPKLAYESHIPEPNIENLTMIGEVYRWGIGGDRSRGILLRALRFQNITQAVEMRYNLPENLLLAMVMQESMGVDLLPNSGDDGGLGLCHMQPSTASEFGLRILDNCKDLRNIPHGKKLRSLIRQHKFDKRKLIKYDDRFHPILNLDAAGRMLWYYKHGPQYKSTPIRTAIYRYAGYKNYKTYYERVTYYRKLLSDKSVIEDVREEFNRLNKHLKINGKPADFDAYIAMHNKLQLNYGLKEYLEMKIIH